MKWHIEDTSIRTYKVMHFGEQPNIVDFVETLKDAPFMRGVGNTAY